jgi:dienelactone hydrolase
MVELLLFHHAQGLTAGCLAFAAELRAAGHTVHTPDLYEGETFASLADGIGFAERVGFDTIVERGRRAADGLPPELVYAGLSLGVMPAQRLAQTRQGARGAVLLHGAVPPAEFGCPWPPGVPLQIHTREADPLGDADVARELAQSVAGAELFLYPGEAHLFTDASLPDYDAAQAALVTRRVRGFLARVDSAR